MKQDENTGIKDTFFFLLNNVSTNTTSYKSLIYTCCQEKTEFVPYAFGTVFCPDMSGFASNSDEAMPPDQVAARVMP